MLTMSKNMHVKQCTSDKTQRMMDCQVKKYCDAVLGPESYFWNTNGSVVQLRKE